MTDIKDKDIIDITEILNLSNLNINVVDDISGMKNIYEIYNKSHIKKWIKLIPTDKTILFNEYNRKDFFIPIADIVLDTELFNLGKKTGTKKRNTLIQFIPKITDIQFNKKTEWLYLLTINDRIVKNRRNKKGY